MRKDKARVLVAKLGLDGHDRALRMLAFELRDRGAEVIMLGTGTTPEQIVEIAIQEDVEVVGISLLSGAHMVLVPLVVDGLRSRHEKVPVVCGGAIPAGDANRLREAGVAAVAPLGTGVREAADLMVAAAQTGMARSQS